MWNGSALPVMGVGSWKKTTTMTFKNTTAKIGVRAHVRIVFAAWKQSTAKSATIVSQAHIKARDYAAAGNNARTHQTGAAAGLQGSGV